MFISFSLFKWLVTDCDLVLAALSLHPSQTDGNSQQISNDSASLWGTLRKSLIAMELADLAAKARPGTDLEVFRRAGFEF